MKDTEASKRKEAERKIGLARQAVSKGSKALEALIAEPELRQ